MSKTTRETWEKPQLLVLVRHKPEEAVLGACKAAGGLGPGGDEASCIYDGAFCGSCQDTASS